MSLITVNTGTYNDMFDDLNAAMGTTLSWTLFDNVSVDEKVFTVPPTTGGFSPISSPSFIRLFRDNTLFSTRLTIYDSWQVGMGVGGATNPVPAVDATTKNVFDFSSAVATAAYRIYGDASEGFIAILHDATGGLTATMGLWIGVLQGRDTPASHPNPNAIFYKTSISSTPAVDFLNNGLTVRSESDATFFGFGFWVNASEPHSGKAVLVTGFAWFAQSSTSGEIAGVGADMFQCSAQLGAGDTVTIASVVHRVMAGGSYAIKE